VTPLELRAVHQQTQVGRRLRLVRPEAPAARVRDVAVGAGFSVVSIGPKWFTVVRERTLADTVGPDMRVLVCGLNPSVYSADAGFGFARPGNRFWPAAIAAGLVGVRDPLHALQHHGVGMTDLVKRATPRADALTADEYRDGHARVERLCAWLQPRLVLFVGLAGWRVAVDRRAAAGRQDHRIGGVPAYVMPSTSGLNAGSSLAQLVAHLREVRLLTGH
jgi:TDG/mug DNA glycosylase family protein